MHAEGNRSVNPWLAVPLEEYEGHMRAVEQSDPLAGLFAEALEHCRPASAAVLGAAGGNGLERVDGRTTRRVVAFDINPEYIDALRRRFPAAEACCVDLASETVDLPPVELVHAALIFEHAGLGLCLENAARLAAPGGALSVVLQRESASVPAVGATPYRAIQALRERFTLVDPAAFGKLLEARGFRLERQSGRALPGGKAFWMGIWRKIRLPSAPGESCGGPE